MTTAGTPTGKLDLVAKWSLIIAPIVLVVFNLLLPTNGIKPLDPEDSSKYIAKLGANGDIAQIYYVVLLLGMLLYTRAVFGLYRIAPEGASKLRLGAGALGSVAALSLWAVLIGIGLAEASVAGNVVDATAAAGAGVAGMAEKAASATLIATALHSAYFGVYQVAVILGFIVMIPVGGGLAISGIVRREFGWLIVVIGVVTAVLAAIMPIKTEAGITTFGIMAVIWGVVVLAMGLQIMRTDRN